MDNEKSFELKGPILAQRVDSPDGPYYNFRIGGQGFCMEEKPFLLDFVNVTTIWAGVSSDYVEELFERVDIETKRQHILQQLVELANIAFRNGVYAFESYDYTDAQIVDVFVDAVLDIVGYKGETK